MIVPMKKVSLIIMGDKKQETLNKLRKLGIVQIEISEGTGEKLNALNEQITLLENAAFTVGKSKNEAQKEISTDEALLLAEQIMALDAEKKQCQAEKVSLTSELERIKSWGEIDPQDINELALKGYELYFYEMPLKEYKALGEGIKAVHLKESRSLIRFMLVKGEADQELISRLEAYRFVMPESSSVKMNERLSAINSRIEEIDQAIKANSRYYESIRQGIKDILKEIEFETYNTGMENEDLNAVSVAYFKGFIEAENVDKLKKTAAENAWGLLVEEPTEEDNVPTKLKNNKLVSLIYPLTDFLGTVPGYFEYDISGWFLSFILIFFGIIFGDGGYGLIICAVALVPIIKALASKKKVSPMFLLVGLFGLSTVLWGTLTCTWFGLSPEQLPTWLKSLSVPVISNVYADKIWYPFWTQGTAGLTTAQNLQIFCFTLALIQLTVAHIKGVKRNRRSIKLLGDIGSILQLLGIYYLVLSLVVNAQVFSFSLVLGGIPVGTVAIILIGIGFVLSFVFSNYEGSVVKSILASLKNIVSVLLGVVNVFSDIVSYIRLWAVGLAGAAISATVNELAGPLLGNFMFVVLAIVLLVFGHGLNMILNILSVIVHGIRLNTLEFSSHLDMSWSGHKFKPFEE
jgi:V/A-type H+-transporting ATPase subunit I